MKICIVCGAAHDKKSNAAKYCHDCATDIWKKQTRASARRLQNERRKKNPRQTKHYKLKKFNMTIGDYESMLREQNGVCAICGHTCSFNRRLAVDHDHSTNKVRGLLCGRCNMGIGVFKDNPELFKSVIDYLSQHLTH